MYFILKNINNFLLQHNICIRNTTQNPFGYYIQKYDDVDFLDNEKGVYTIPLEKCVSQYYFSYDKKGWHYYKATVEEYLKNERICYKDSILYKFYKKFQPKNLYEVLFDEDKPGYEMLKSLPNVAVRDFWNLGGTVKNINDYTVQEESQLFGPISDLYGEEQFRRCIRSYQLIKKHGYVPEKFHDGYISGYFFKKRDDYRFCIMSGKHRVSALSVLGVKELKVKTRPFIRVISLDRLDRVPIVQSGLISEKLAGELIGRYFEENGTNRAKKIGLI